MNETSSFEELLKFIPKHIQLMYEKRGIRNMFPWQIECLSVDGVLHGKNLIYSAPTSAGKTLVAEILCLQSVLAMKKKAIIILPFVSVVREKMFYFQDLLCESGVRVEGFMGSYHPPGGFKAVDIAICTIEKANNLINRLMEEEELSEVGCVVVDELHMLGDSHRGYLLELLLTKLKFISRRDASVNMQIVGMSATLPNLNVVAQWLDAALYRTDFRPIPLQEYLKVDRALYSSSNNLLYHIEPHIDIKNDPGDVLFLCIDTIVLGYSILVFCPTKNWCETLSQQIASEIRRLGNDPMSDVGVSLRGQLNSKEISDMLERLKRCPVGLDPNLGRSIAFGVSFHHAGLTMDERDIVEEGFKSGVLRVLVATTTLSSGVNLPARRVLVRSPLFNSRPLDILTYKQMIGRAGRMGHDTEGESYLICTEREREYGKALLSSDLPPISSCLASSDLSSSLTRAILEIVASGVAGSRQEVEEYTACTLVYACDPTSLIKPLETCLSYLETHEFTRSLSEGNVISPSPLAQATLSASLYPHQAVKLLQELHRASSSFILNNHLHAIYQVTPYSVSDQWAVDWVKMFTAWEKLSPDMKAVGHLVGIEDSFLVRAIQTNVNSDKNVEKLSIHRRFYTALALQDLINEVSLNTIIDKYSCNKGMLQSLQQSSSTFAGMVTKFCGRLGWSGLEAILEQLSSRIEYGAQRDLLDLLRLDCFSAQLARALYNSGITTVAELASSSSRSVQTAITKLMPFQSENLSTEERSSKCIWVTGKAGLTEAEAAQYFIDISRKFILKEMGVAKADWNDETSAANRMDSIYLNSTINPYDLSKSCERSRRKLSVPSNLKPIDNSTPVTTARHANIKTTPLQTAANSSTSKDVKRLFIDLLNTDAPSPLNLELVNGDLQNIKEGSSITFDQINKDLSNVDENSFLNMEGINCRLAEPTNNSTPINRRSIKNYVQTNNSRLSNGDMFDSTNDVVFNISSEIVFTEFHQNEKVNGQETSSKPEILIQDEINSETCGGVNDDKKCGNDADRQINDVRNDIVGETPNTYCNGNQTNDDICSNVEKSKTRNSLDAFFESFSFNSSSFSEAVVAACGGGGVCGQALNELDCNWGGESLLEASFLLNNISKQFSPVSVKRKLSTSGETVAKRARNKSNIKFPVTPMQVPTATASHKPPLPLSVQTKMESNVKITTICRNEGAHNVSDSDSSIVESPSQKVDKSQTKKPPCMLYLSNVVKTRAGDDSEISLSKDAKSAFKNITKKPSVGMSDSSLEAAFADSFNHTSSSSFKLSMNPVQSYIGSSLTTKCQLSTKKNHNLPRAVSKVKTPRENLIVAESQDVFMAPPRDCGEGVVAGNISDAMKTTTKIQPLLSSPVKNLKERRIRETSLSPRRNRKETIHDSPSKYNRLNVKIVKTPDKSSNTIDSFCIDSNPCNSNIDSNLMTCEGPVCASLSKANLDNVTTTGRDNRIKAELISKNSSNSVDILCVDSVTPLIKSSLKSNEVTTKNDGSSSHLNPLNTSISNRENNQILTEVLSANCKINVNSSSLSKCKANPLNALSTNAESIRVKATFKNKVEEEPCLHNHPRLILPCESEELLREFELYLSDCTDLAISLNMSTVNQTGSNYGSKMRRHVSEGALSSCEKKYMYGNISMDGVAFYSGGENVYYINLLCQCGLCLEVLTYTFNRTDLSLSMFNMRQPLRLLYKCCAISVECCLSDPLVADWLINPQDKCKSFDTMVNECGRNFKMDPVRYNDCTDQVIQVWHLMSSLKIKMSSIGLLQYFYCVEMPVSRILIYSELTGIGFDVPAARSLMRTVCDTMKKLEESAHNKAKRTFNLNSWNELAKIKRFLKITSDNEREQSLMEIIRDWRKLHSLKTRNLSSLLIDPREVVHPVSDIRTCTGRITLSEPDLQHIPRDFTVNSTTAYLFSPRSCFIPRQGNVFVAADYCQLELRILTHFSQDEALLSVFKSQSDIFRNIAAKWNHVPLEEVTDEMRQTSKKICYGLMYGMGYAALGNELGIPPSEAARLQAEFKLSYPSVRVFIENTLSDAKTTGSIRTLAGRTRLLPNINSSNPAFSKQGERQAVNSTIQGSASDIAKQALVKIETTLSELITERPRVMTDDCACHLVLHLHDEFIYEVSPRYLKLFIPVMKSCMEEAVELSLPLPVKVKSGKSWAQLDPVS